MSVRASGRGAKRAPAATAEPQADAPEQDPTGEPASTSAANGAAPSPGSAETVTRRLHRLALDVHDGPMQNLAVIGFSLGDLRRRMRSVLPPEHQTRIDAGLEMITDELGKVESELRLLIGALEQGASTNVPLREAIETEIRAFEQRCDTHVVFLFDDKARADTDSQRIALQSVTRAALSNVAKHASAQQVSVRVTTDGDATVLEIEDDGSGFRADLPPKRGRMGLVGMKRRVELLGGEFQIDSRPGGPTTVTVALHPWQPAGEE